jgi:hypothetical protein
VDGLGWVGGARTTWTKTCGNEKGQRAYPETETEGCHLRRGDRIVFRPLVEELVSFLFVADGDAEFFLGFGAVSCAKQGMSERACDLRLVRQTASRDAEERECFSGTIQPDVEQVPEIVSIPGAMRDERES